MSDRTLNLDDRLYRYLMEHTAPEHPVQRELREATAGMPQAGMQIAPDQGAFLALLVQLLGAWRALPPDGRIVACDVSEEWTSMARKFWEKAGVAGKIDLRLAPAVETLDKLIAAGGAGQYDFAFIDADKTGYGAYYERCLTLLRRGGLIAVDNTLWSGAVADPARQDKDTRAIREFNDALRADPRVALSMLPVGDGVTLALKR